MIKQVGGTHYQYEYQTWDFIIDGKYDYLTGNVIKYLSRFEKKDGSKDLLKAISYIDKMYATDTVVNTSVSKDLITKYLKQLSKKSKDLLTPFLNNEINSTKYLIRKELAEIYKE